MDDELRGFDALLVAGVAEEASGELAVLGAGQQPADRVAAEEVEDDVEAVVDAAVRAPQQYNPLRRVPAARR